MTRIVLASASPRRKELLAALVDAFDIVPSRIDEPLSGEPAPDAERLARDKAREVAASFPDAVVIGADTVVHDGARAYEKPVDAADALAMWRALRGRAHHVYTGVAVIRDGEERTGVSHSAVTLTDLTDTAIEQYVASGRPMDKAGGYAIQDEDVPTVADLRGCYCCVVGLPLWRLRRDLHAFGIETRGPHLTFERCAACPERS